MRLDLVSGWELLAVQVFALVVVATTLFVIGNAFRRSRAARWSSLVAAVVAGAAIAASILRADEAAVSSYLFAACVFMLGTVAMSILLLAAIPKTRQAALGGMIAGALTIVSFVLTYYALFTFTPVRWITGR